MVHADSAESLLADPLLVSPIASPGLHPIPLNTALPNSATGREL